MKSSVTLFEKSKSYLITFTFWLHKSLQTGKTESVLAQQHFWMS